MSIPNTHQQSLADVGPETTPLMLERGSYIPLASHFRRYLNRKRETRKWLNEEINEGSYEFKVFTPSKTKAPRMQKEEDLRGDDLKHYEAGIRAMNLILISIPNDIYSSMDACTTAKACGKEQKNTLAEFMILSGADNRPTMLDKDLYDSWKIRIELFIQNRKYGRMIFESVKNGPLIWPIVEENGVTRTKKYAELSIVEKI
uniref:Uncharacterized protein n=1 Tax=Tanacetum cinerariifolium TaxID=118510 RepID=A0A6L2KZY8_TANCI|nr:hypothetical protein [Tanacetum cinerariifolium]